jgi:hypothetical protein
MQDKWSHKELADQGWQAMEALLDQEMPVVQSSGRRKRWLLLLLFLLLGFTLAYGSFWWWKAEAQPIVLNPPPSAADMEQSETAEGTIRAQQPAKTATDNFIENKPSKPIPSTPVLKNNNQPPKGPAGTSGLSGAQATPERQVIAAAAAPAPAEKEIELGAEKMPEAKEGITEQAVASPLITAPLSVSLFDQLPARTFAVAQDEAVSNLSLEVVRNTSSGLAYRGLSLELGAITQEGIHLDGGVLRLLVDFKGQNSGFGLSTGIGYRLHTNTIPATDRRFSNSLSALLDQASDTFTETTTGGLSVEDFESLRAGKAASAPALNAAIQYRHEVTLPILATYSLGHQWRLDAGPEFGYLFGLTEERSTQESALMDQFGNEFDPSNSQAQVDGKDVFNRFRMRVGGGVSYYPVPRLGIRFQYQHLLTDRFLDRVPGGVSISNNSYQFSLLLNW